MGGPTLIVLLPGPVNLLKKRILIDLLTEIGSYFEIKTGEEFEFSLVDTRPLGGEYYNLNRPFSVVIQEPEDNQETQAAFKREFGFVPQQELLLDAFSNSDIITMHLAS